MSIIIDISFALLDWTLKVGRYVFCSLRTSCRCLTSNFQGWRMGWSLLSSGGSFTQKYNKWSVSAQDMFFFFLFISRNTQFFDASELCSGFRIMTQNMHTFNKVLMEMALLSANSIVGYKLIAFNYKGNREQFLLMLLSVLFSKLL
jgi:hypothetical protein